MRVLFTVAMLQSCTRCRDECMRWQPALVACLSVQSTRFRRALCDTTLANVSLTDRPMLLSCICWLLSCLFVYPTSRPALVNHRGATSPDAALVLLSSSNRLCSGFTPLVWNQKGRLDCRKSCLNEVLWRLGQIDRWPDLLGVNACHQRPWRSVCQR